MPINAILLQRSPELISNKPHFTYTILCSVKVLKIAQSKQQDGDQLTIRTLVSLEHPTLSKTNLTKQYYQVYQKLLHHNRSVPQVLADTSVLEKGICSSRIKGCPQANYTWSQISRMRRSLEQIKQFEVKSRTKSINSYNSKKNNQMSNTI